MANNRMWLIYKPTGHAVILGKRLGDGWYCPYETPPVSGSKLSDDLDRLFEIAEATGYGMDDFALGLEIGDGNPHSFNEWQYGPGQTPPGQPKQLKLTAPSNDRST